MQTQAFFDLALVVVLRQIVGILLCFAQDLSDAILGKASIGRIAKKDLPALHVLRHGIYLLQRTLEERVPAKRQEAARTGLTFGAYVEVVPGHYAGGKG